jgi:hypothetical protein
MLAYNFAKRLKTLKGLTPYEYICQRWQQHPERFLFDPSHLTLGLDIWLLDHIDSEVEAFYQVYTLSMR